MDKQTSAQKRFISYLKRRDPKLNDKDIPPLLVSFKRFVNVVQKIYTEPQAQITIDDKKVDNKMTHRRVITTDISELKKVLDKNQKQQPILETLKKFNKAVTKDKYGR